MFRYMKIVYFVAFFIFGALLCQINTASAKQIIDAPAAVKISQHELGKPFITGLTPAGTEVLIYVNGIYAGLAEINIENTETDNFYYKHNSFLSEGTHKIILASRDKVSLVLSPHSQEIKFVVPALSVPALIEPNIDTVVGKVKPLIKGLSLSGTFVRVYIDGIYNGKTKIITHESGTANFAYKPFLNLAPGRHFAQAVSEDSSGRKSKKSDILNFNIEQPMPAPTLLAMEFSGRTGHNRPFIVGLAKNDSLIKVFVDHKLDGQFKAKNNNSGTANFAYKPFQPLANGNHFVYITATDDRGKESLWSNIIYFNISEEGHAASAQITADLEQEQKMRQEEKVEVKGSDLEKKDVIIQDYEETPKGIEAEKITDKEIKEIMEEEIVKEEDGKGLINESKQAQGGLNFNLIIFIAFLFGIIAWIFWVNKELVKERKTQTEKEKILEDSGKDNTPFSDRESRH